MAPRRRVQGREEWPEGLHKKAVRGVDRYFFRNEKGKDVFFPEGTSFIDAYHAAQSYNEMYRDPASIFASKLDKYNRPLIDWGKVIIGRVKSEEELGENAFNTFVKDVERLNVLFGHVLSKEITSEHATDYLNHYCVEPGKSKNVYNRKLSFLNKYFDYLMDEQGVDIHPSSGKKFKMIKREEKKKDRADLDKDAYLKIYDAAPLWLKVAMSICLQSTHAVKELHRLKHKLMKPKEGECGCVWFKEPKQTWCDISKQNVMTFGTMYIHRHKSQHKKSSFVAIPITPELKTAIDLSKTDRLVCPYIVRRKPIKNNKISKYCDHRFQMTSNNISRGFSDVRDQLGLFDHLPKERRPTFHEIRRLSAKALKSSGQNLTQRMAHADENTTRIYTDTHDVEWVEVAPLSVNL
ncbi:tyrosine-type recombinase/integrase [Pseudoalteromonas sp. McH1-7]|uniref:tyrosine-type recombinase/integrase n=1 Tax=Pseudoalteromonas sp. McH1-7 TaxID=2745574 RepID=UPI001592A227|nr:tyrosine-type recombinase/integrase [Pseudoalteromonas sp. McH1-7]NUZ10008.1 tyrosine-type recombinase/integrase [Pseudoalteromonas sp. McH1-7]